MRKVVLLAPYFLPRRRVGSWRPFKFAIHLQEYGWHPHIITIQDSTGTLTAKEKRLLADIPIYSIKPPFDFTGDSGSAMDQKKEKSTSGGSGGLFDTLLDLIDKNFPIDTWLPLFWLRKSKILQQVKEIAPHVIWSTGDPWSSHWLGRHIADKLSKPWVADFRDPWTLGDVNLKHRSAFSSTIDGKAEQDVVRKASMLTFTSKATENLYRRYYANLNPRTATLYNCFDRALYHTVQENEAKFSDQKLNLLFFGKFRRLSPARPLIDILVKFKETYSVDEIPIKVHSFGPLSKEDEACARENEVLGCFRAHPAIPAEEALAVLPKADILWLSTDPKRVNIIPAKLWDYLAAGQPILSIAPNPEIAAILEETGAGVQIDHQKMQKAADILQQSILAKQQGKPLPIAASFKQEMIEKYEAKQVTAKLASLFDQLV